MSEKIAFESKKSENNYIITEKPSFVYRIFKKMHYFLERTLCNNKQMSRAVFNFFLKRLPFWFMCICE